MDYDIFISYRRDGGSYYARILKAELEKRGYADRVFLDYDGLKDGRFDNRIMQAIDGARIFIFILSPGALERCKDEEDWVRKEILYAIEHERHIIPINFDNLFDGFPSQIPEKIREALGQHQFSKIDSESLLEASMDKLIGERIAPVVAPRSYGRQPGGTAEIMIISDVECEVKLFGKPLCHILADSPTPLHLKKGNYLLEFISTQCPQISERQRCTVPDNDYVDFIEIHLKERVDKIANRVLKCVSNSKGKYGYIDESGEVIIPLRYDQAGEFSEGLAPAKTGRVWDLIDESGKTAFSLICSGIGHFREGLAPVKDESGWGFVDKSGQLVIPHIYKDCEFFHEGLAAVETDSGWGFIDKSGKVVIPCIYKDTGFFSEGLARVKTDSGWGFIDKNGNSVISCMYNYANDFSEGLAHVKNNNNWGYIDKTGKFVIPCKYFFCGKFREGVALVLTLSGPLYINKSGQVVIIPKYRETYEFKEGLAAVKSTEDSKDVLGYIDSNGDLAIPFEYDWEKSRERDFRNGWAEVQLKDSATEGYVNRKGKFIAKSSL